MTQTEIIKALGGYKHILSKAQISTIRGQALAGDIAGAEKGLNKLLRRQNGKTSKGNSPRQV